MPYEGEMANKASHFDIINDPDVRNFLNECDYLRPPSEEEGRKIKDNFLVPPDYSQATLPRKIIAIDGSFYLSNISERLSSTEISYVKIGSVLIDMTKFGGIREGRYVDPFKVADLLKDSDALKFILPSSNICWQDKSTVRDSFRAAIDAQLLGKKTRFKPDDHKTSLRTTLFHLASRRPKDMGTNDPHFLNIHQCPNCGEGPIKVEDVEEPQFCHSCSTEIYPSDCLRLWEEINELQSNYSATMRFMQAIEHLLPIHYIRHLVDNSLSALGSTAFFVDRPLALFGTSAWMHRTIMEYLAEVNTKLHQINQPPILIIGLQKTGQVVDHVRLIERFLEPNTIFAIDDEYRYSRIIPGRNPAANGFGMETYYGQDFIYKTPNQRNFVFALPYPFSSKEDSDFINIKIDLSIYKNLPRALALINKLECDLYENSIIPIALANRYTAISLMPGGKVLDLYTKLILEGNSTNGQTS